MSLLHSRAPAVLCVLVCSVQCVRFVPFSPAIMSVFQDEGDDDGQQYAHLQAAAASSGHPSSVSTATTLLSQQQASIASGNPFGSADDGFAGTRSVSNSVFVTESLPTSGTTEAAGTVAAPYGAVSASSTLSDVNTTAQPSRLAELAALPAYVPQPLDTEEEAAKSKHGKITVGEPELRSPTHTHAPHTSKHTTEAHMYPWMGGATAVAAC